MRTDHTAVWTGSEMVVWGGSVGGSSNTGGRYSPSTDNWRDTSLLGAPEGRYYHTAVWTGSDMIVWGGRTDPSALTAAGGMIPRRQLENCQHDECANAQRFAHGSFHRS